MTLEDTLDALKERGLLERASYVKCGEVEIHLGPPMLADVGPAQKEMTLDEEVEEMKRSLYGASRGYTPGVT